MSDIQAKIVFFFFYPTNANYKPLSTGALTPPPLLGEGSHMADNLKPLATRSLLITRMAVTWIDK